VGQSRWVGAGAPPPEVGAFCHRPFSDLRALLRAPGLWVGYLSYDLGRWVEELPRCAGADRCWPIVDLRYCPWWLEHDGASGRWTLHGEAGGADGPPELGRLRACEGCDEFEAGEPVSLVEPEAYRASVQACIDAIGRGDAFQINLAQRFTAGFKGRWPGAARGLYRALSGASPAWYGAHLELSDPGDGRQPHRALLSTSPELFLEVGAGGEVVTRPIKGTRPAACPAQELWDSAKDQAELNMIVDLMRNDLGRVCDYGSVRVTRAREIESHPTVHHGVATVAGRLHPGRDLADLLRATLPPGSVTGAPKVQAMRLIEELEPARRGPYCGALGWLRGDRACLSVAIRTLLVETAPPLIPGSPLSWDGPGGVEESGRVDFSVGGGVTAESGPALEHQETLDKAAAAMAALRRGAKLRAS
jgi:para-aminobenzoate synthetase component 1